MKTGWMTGNKTGGSNRFEQRGDRSSLTYCVLQDGLERGAGRLSGGWGCWLPDLINADTMHLLKYCTVPHT